MRYSTHPGWCHLGPILDPSACRTLLSHLMKRQRLWPRWTPVVHDAKLSYLHIDVLQNLRVLLWGETRWSADSLVLFAKVQIIFFLIRVLSLILAYGMIARSRTRFLQQCLMFWIVRSKYGFRISHRPLALRKESRGWSMIDRPWLVDLTSSPSAPHLLSRLSILHILNYLCVSPLPSGPRISIGDRDEHPFSMLSPSSISSSLATSMVR